MPGKVRPGGGGFTAKRIAFGFLLPKALLDVTR